MNRRRRLQPGFWRWPLRREGRRWARAGCEARLELERRPRARKCLFGRGQDLGWSLAFNGEDASRQGPNGEAFPSRRFSPTAPRGPGPTDPPGDRPAKPSCVGLVLGHQTLETTAGTNRGSAQEVPAGPRSRGPSGNVWHPVSPGRGSRGGASRLLPDGPSASSRRDLIGQLRGPAAVPVCPAG